MKENLKGTIQSPSYLSQRPMWLHSATLEKLRKRGKKQWKDKGKSRELWWNKYSTHSRLPKSYKNTVYPVSMNPYQELAVVLQLFSVHLWVSVHGREQETCVKLKQRYSAWNMDF